jgi:hypothetical protein
MTVKRESTNQDPFLFVMEIAGLMLAHGGTRSALEKN